MKAIQSRSLLGSNNCIKKREKVFTLSEGKNDRLDRIIFERRVVLNWFRSLSLRGREEEVLDAIWLIKAGEKRDDVPESILYVYDSVKSILRADGTFDLRSGDFDEAKAFVTCQLACRKRYVDQVIRRNYLENFFFDTKESAEVNAAEVSAKILRYLSEEKRSFIIPDEMTIDLFGQDVVVKPDLLYVNPKKKFIEAIKIKTGKSTVSDKGRARDKNITNNKELYALFCYSRHVAKSLGWPEEDCSGSYYFLRKEADRPTARYIDPGYFGSSNMKHVASLRANSVRTPEKIDEIFEPQFEAYLIGEECSGKDCEGCDRYELCNFAEAPLKTEVERKEKSPDTLSLSPAQEKIVHFQEGVMCCNAGAGSGKSTTVSLNISLMIAGGALPASILAVTFSRTGTIEVKNRSWSYLKGLGLAKEKSIEELQDEMETKDPQDIIMRAITVNGEERNFDDISIVTFNEFGQHILNNKFAELGFTAPPRPIDNTERSAIIAELLDEQPVPGLYYQNINLNLAKTRFKGARLVVESAFEHIKRERLSIYEEKRLRALMSDCSSCISDEGAYKALLELYEKYDETLRSRNLVEFQDQEMIGFFEALDHDPYLFDKLGYKHIIIDEYQDTSKNQMEVLYELLSVSEFESCLVVGDDSQGIYGWRQADISNIVDFEEKIRDRLGMSVEIVNLVENYRSTPEIIEFANAINALNDRRVEKDLVATRESGKPVIVKGFHSVAKEHEFVVKKIEEAKKEGRALEDIAILTRTKKEAVTFAGVLAEAGIESSIQAPQKMLENSRVQGICSLARAYKDPEATKHVLIFMNCLEGGKVIEGTDEEIEQVIAEGQDMMRSLWHLAPGQKVTAFRNIVDEIAADDDIAINLAGRLERFQNIDQIIDYIEAFIRFDGEDLRREGLYSGVVISTAHSSKGLEWPVVINSITAYDKAEGMSDFEREEQRRLLFVSSTRARDELIVTGQVKIKGTAKDEGFAVNRFLDEAATIAGQPLDYFDEEGKAERELRKAERAAKLKEEKEAKAAAKAKAEALPKMKTKVAV